MPKLRKVLINMTINRATALIIDFISYNTHIDFHHQHELIEEIILSDKSLTKSEKIEAIRLRNKDYDREKMFYNSGIERKCKNCNQKSLATLYCEYCVRNFLKKNFKYWTSGNNDIDNLIQKCQLETLGPDNITEWIPYKNLKDIKYLAKGGFSNIYTTIWIDGKYQNWNSKKQRLIKSGPGKVVLKELENVNSASQSWFEEVRSLITISNKYSEVIPCYGLTQNPSNGNYMIVMNKMDINLRDYLKLNHNQLTWKERMNLIYLIVNTLNCIHKENLIHRDLHSGNILYSQFNNGWYISDFGFCGPADKSPTSIYGNLPYIAPEVLRGEKYTYKSDIYSIAMLMWEISSGQPPFNDYKYRNDLGLTLDIVIHGIRPEIVPGTPPKYKKLMEHCWDVDPSKRPDINELLKEIKYYPIKPKKLKIKMGEETTSTSSKLRTSKIHKNLSELRSTTEDQEEFYGKPYDSNNSYNSSDKIEIRDNSKELDDLRIPDGNEINE